MSNFFHSLLARSGAPVQAVRPRVLSLFETQGKNVSLPADEALEQEAEEEVTVKPRRRPHNRVRQSFLAPAVDERVEPVIDEPHRAPAFVAQSAGAVPERRAEPAVEQEDSLRAEHPPRDVVPRLVVPSSERDEAPPTAVREIVRDHETTFEHEVFSERTLNETEVRHSIIETVLPGRVEQMLSSAGSIETPREATRPAPRLLARETDEPVIHVSIGRIEVRAVSEPAPRRKESQPSGVMSLHDYLRSRQKGGVR